MENDSTTMRCKTCNRPLETRVYEHVEKVGPNRVVNRTGMRPQCGTCGTVDLNLDELERFEQLAARVALSEGKVDGEVVRYARKALGLSQKELAALMEYRHETVSRWENDKEAAPRTAIQALVGLISLALEGQDLSALFAEANATSPQLEVHTPPKKRAC